MLPTTPGLQMSFKSRPFFFFPAAIIGIAIAIVFFKLYGRATRPDVPAPVANTLNYFAPGVALLKPVKDIKGLGELQWVRHVGFVSNYPRAGFVQTRLLVSPEEAAKEVGDPNAKVMAVELVSLKNEMYGMRNEAESSIRTGPKVGCVFSHRDGLPAHRTVSYWTTKTDLGGFAFIEGLSKRDTLSEQLERKRYLDSVELARQQGGKSLRSYSYVPYTRGEEKKFVVWSMIIWNGKFEGAKTLRADFEERPCSDLGGKEEPAAALRASIEASDSLLAAFDVVGAKQHEADLQAAARAQMDSLGRFAEACMTTNVVHTDGWTRRNLGSLPITVLMPADYTRRERRGGEGPDSLAQVFTSPDGAAIQFSRQATRWDLSAVPDLGMETDCEATIAGTAAHLETGRRHPALITKTTSASFELPTGAWLVVIASSPTLERQQQQLRMIREVQFTSQWGKPGANPPRMPIDSL